MINLHFIIAGIFLLIGFCMRFGLWNQLVVYAYKNITKLSRQKFDEFEIRRYIGETSIKLGFIILMIALVGVFDRKDFNLAMVFGWFSFIFYAIASMTFAEKIDIFDKRRKARQKAKFEQMKAIYDEVERSNQTSESDSVSDLIDELSKGTDR